MNKTFKTKHGIEYTFNHKDKINIPWQYIEDHNFMKVVDKDYNPEQYGDFEECLILTEGEYDNPNVMYVELWEGYVVIVIPPKDIYTYQNDGGEFYFGDLHD